MITESWGVELFGATPKTMMPALENNFRKLILLQLCYHLKDAIINQHALRNFHKIISEMFLNIFIMNKK